MCDCLPAECTNLVKRSFTFEALKQGLQATVGTRLTQGFDHFDHPKDEHPIWLGALVLVREEFPRVACQCTYVQMLDAVHSDLSMLMAFNGHHLLLFCHKDDAQALNKDAVELQFPGSSWTRECKSHWDADGQPWVDGHGERPVSRQVYLPAFVTMCFDRPCNVRGTRRPGASRHART